MSRNAAVLSHVSLAKLEARGGPDKVYAGTHYSIASVMINGPKAFLFRSRRNQRESSSVAEQ